MWLWYLFYDDMNYWYFIRILVSIIINFDDLIVIQNLIATQIQGRGDKLPAEVKEAKEKELEDLKSQFKDKQVKARSDKFSAKYKMVRFLGNNYKIL